MPLSLRHLLFSLALFLAGASACTASASSPLAGSWAIDLARSTELSPWKSYDLTITIVGDTVTFDRHLAWGRREFRDQLVLELTKPETVAPVEMWPDNRHLGAYIADDHVKRVRASWLDDHRILRVSTDLTLSTQQGDRAVNILSDYKVSANGAQLTLTELRSTRNRPIVYIFHRVAASP